MTDNSWCIVHGTPGRDPLTVEGPFDRSEAASAKAETYMEVRPDVAAIVDVLVHPDNSGIRGNVHSDDPDNAPQPTRFSLVGDLKHATYDPSPTDLIDRLRELIHALEQHTDALDAPNLNDAERQRLWRGEPTLAAHRSTGAPADHVLHECMQRLVLLRERISRHISRANMTRGVHQ